jgi:hypothetical protein
MNGTHTYHHYGGPQWSRDKYSMFLTFTLSPSDITNRNSIYVNFNANVYHKSMPRTSFKVPAKSATVAESGTVANIIVGMALIGGTLTVTGGTVEGQIIMIIETVDVVGIVQAAAIMARLCRSRLTIWLYLVHRPFGWINPKKRRKIPKSDRVGMGKMGVVWEVEGIIQIV